MDNRTNKQNYYLDIADAVLDRSTCLRKKYGAIIVRNDEIISTGYNGAPRGRKNCSDLGRCMREELKIPSGERYELCRSVHAEANAIISCEPITQNADFIPSRRVLTPSLWKMKYSSPFVETGPVIFTTGMPFSSYSRSVG